MYNKKDLIFLCCLFLSFAFTFWCCAGKDEPKNNKKLGYKHSVNIVDEDSLKKIINENSGNIVFINVWATWCEPCVKEFPDIVKISNEYKDKGVKFLSLSVDSKSDIDSSVIPFLKKQNAELPVYLVNEKRSEKIINFLNPEWSGAVPATIIYDKNGKKQKFLLGMQSYSQFKNSIDSVRSLL